MISIVDKDPALIDIFRAIKAIPKTIGTVNRLFYSGNFAGSEFLTYSATKLYVCERITFHISNFGASAYDMAKLNNVFYDHLDGIWFRSSNSRGLYDGAATSYITVAYDLKNFYFSRIVNGSHFAGLTFLGYRIAIS